MTSRRIAELPSLRSEAAFRALLRSFTAGKDRPGFRLVCFSVQSNHVHLIVEADDRVRLSRGLQGLFVRMARAVNRAWGRRGQVFEGQYDSRPLRSPLAVRNALVYVLQNAWKHGLTLDGLDPCSSARWFQGWSPCARPEPWWRSAPVAEPRTWLLRTGWLRYGRLEPIERPRSGAGRAT